MRVFVASGIRVGVGQAGAGVRHDGRAAGPTDIEPELVGSNAEAGIRLSFCLTCVKLL